MNVYLGIDFGTSNSSIAYVLPDPRQTAIIPVKTIRVSVDELDATSDRVPTVVSVQFDKKQSKEILVGWAFFKQFLRPKKKASLLRHGQSLFRSVKSDLGSFRIYPYAFSPELNTPEKVASTVIRLLLEEAKRKDLQGYDLRKAHVVVTVPASLSALGREQTLEAAQLAGLDRKRVELIDEPIAALLDFLNDGRAAGVLDMREKKNLLIFDYGGGTLDLSLVRARFNLRNRTGLEVEHLAISQYRRLGGDDVDQAVMKEVVWPQIEEYRGHDRQDFRADVRQMIEDTLTPTVARRLKERACKELSNPARRRPHVIVEKIERDFEKVKLPKRVRMTAGDFEHLMGPFLAVPKDGSDESMAAVPKSLLVPVLEVAREAGIHPSAISAIILHGGSCRNPLVRKLLERAFSAHKTLFGGAPILETPELASVARGAALAGYWRHERDADIVPPITAEELGIMTLDDQPVVLVDSGQRLPFPDENSSYTVPTEFYVPQEGLHEMLVPFYTGRRRKPAGEAVRVQLPAGVKRAAPVQIKLRLERDKTLHWWYSVNGRPPEQAEPRQNPWMLESPSSELRNLLDRRREIRESFLKTGTVPVWMELDEASLLYDAGHYDDAELAIRDLEQRNGSNARTANLRGVLHSANGDEEAALRCFREAAELDPHPHPVWIGNYGCVLADVGKVEEAEAMMRKALAADPNLYYVLERLGDLYRQRKDEINARREFDEAVRVIERQIAQNLESKQLWGNAARLYQKIGEYERAREARSKAIKIEREVRLGGEDAIRIAGPDSGILRVEELTAGDES